MGCHKACCARSGWYYRKRRRERLGLPKIKRGRPRKGTETIRLAARKGWLVEDNTDN